MEQVERTRAKLTTRARQKNDSKPKQEPNALNNPGGPSLGAKELGNSFLLSC